MIASTDEVDATEAARGEKVDGTMAEPNIIELFYSIRNSVV